jgi:hypothetical protein
MMILPAAVAVLAELVALAVATYVPPAGATQRTLDPLSSRNAPPVAVHAMLGMSPSFSAEEDKMTESRSVSPGFADLGETRISSTEIGWEVPLSVGVPPFSSSLHAATSASTAAAHRSRYRFNRTNVFKCKPPVLDRATRTRPRGSPDVVSR